MCAHRACTAGSRLPSDELHACARNRWDACKLFLDKSVQAVDHKVLTFESLCLICLMSASHLPRWWIADVRLVLLFVSTTSRDAVNRINVARYLLGASAVAAALGLRLVFIPLMGTGAPFAFFFGAVTVTSLAAGVGPGIFALLLSLPLAAYWFVTSPGHPLPQA